MWHPSRASNGKLSMSLTATIENPRSDFTKPKKESRVFGPIPGIRVLKTFPDREACYRAAVHGLLQGGIHGKVADGAYSVVLSGGWDEDEDKGDTFVYTGSGGTSVKGLDGPRGGGSYNLVQKEDQSFENRNNAALKRSAETKRPVRVIRGYFKEKKDRRFDSPYAPVEGYRYDGLYIVDRAYMKDGTQWKDGRKLKVCAFDFRRMQGQPPIPVRGL